MSSLLDIFSITHGGRPSPTDDTAPPEPSEYESLLYQASNLLDELDLAKWNRSYWLSPEMTLRTPVEKAFSKASEEIEHIEKLNEGLEHLNHRIQEIKENAHAQCPTEKIPLKVGSKSLDPCDLFGKNYFSDTDSKNVHFKIQGLHHFLLDLAHKPLADRSPDFQKRKAIVQAVFAQVKARFRGNHPLGNLSYLADKTTGGNTMATYDPDRNLIAIRYLQTAEESTVTHLRIMAHEWYHSVDLKANLEEKKVSQQLFVISSKLDEAHKTNTEFVEERAKRDENGDPLPESIQELKREILQLQNEKRALEDRLYQTLYEAELRAYLFASEFLKLLTAHYPCLKLRIMEDNALYENHHFSLEGLEEHLEKNYRLETYKGAPIVPISKLKVSNPRALDLLDAVTPK